MKKTLIKVLATVGIFLSITALASPAQIKIINHETDIQQCKLHNIQGKILLITSQYCHACQEMEPRILAAIKKNNLESKLIHIHISNPKERAILNQKYHLDAFFLPTLIVNCHAFIGEKPQGFYQQLFADYNENK
ncbi:MAG: hypothetical protein JXR42_02395 [Gammaproteobacteria bacterium]|nr:hypothetical protein [Gammaproteobacteria bacterium]